MTISDLLTLFGILLAIFAFIAERNREYVFLKLSVINIRFIIGFFIYIHFLLSYDWWLSKFEWLSVFVFSEFPSADVWAYVFSVAILIWSVWCIFYGEFPLSRKEKLISYYRKLILRNDIPFLAQLIEDYHLKQIIEYIKATREILEFRDSTNDNSVVSYRNNSINNEDYLKKINHETLTYGSYTYYDFVINDIFIENVASINPYLFANIIQELTYTSSGGADFVNKFLKVLMVNKNSNFFREIRDNQNFSEFKAYRIDKERPILYALFNDIKVCSSNQAWRGVGDQAVLEMIEESKKEYSSLRESNYSQEDNTIWTYQINIAIWYFDIMVRQAIVQKVNDHMWMFYYSHFCKTILSNMQDLPSELSEQNRKSRNFDLLDMIFSKMKDWIDVGRDSSNNYLADSIYECIGKCVGELTKSNKLRVEDKFYLINWIWEHLMQLTINIRINTEATEEEKEKIATEREKKKKVDDELVNYGFKAFNNVINFIEEKQQKNDYLRLLNYLWDKRDTPRLNGIYGERADRFKKEVIDKLERDLQ